MNKNIIDNKWIDGDSKYVCDFKIISRHGTDKGEYWDLTKRTDVYLCQHETVSEIYETTEHEDIHRCLDVISESGNMTINQEHDLISTLMFVREGIVF